MKNLLPKSIPASFPKSKKEESEFGKSKKGIIICKKCNAMLWQGSWHHESEIKKNIKKNKYNGFSICPACKMIEDNMYEGELIIRNVNPEIKKYIINAIKNKGKKGFKNDSQDRVISVNDDHDGKMNIFTTENQLALKIARKIKKSFNGTMKVIYSKKESVIRIYIVLQDTKTAY
ncbi:MAG: NMD3-related protein [Candidatus Pacebacteria bacterium]|nr:NMD3-related protein [Candidatus Paceibacterota bacterium]